jgi:hypothetical protein
MKRKGNLSRGSKAAIFPPLGLRQLTNAVVPGGGGGILRPPGMEVAIERAGGGGDGSRPGAASVGLQSDGGA